MWGETWAYPRHWGSLLGCWERGVAGFWRTWGHVLCTYGFATFAHALIPSTQVTATPAPKVMDENGNGTSNGDIKKFRGNSRQNDMQHSVWTYSSSRHHLCWTFADRVSCALGRLLSCRGARRRDLCAQREEEGDEEERGEREHLLKNGTLVRRAGIYLDRSDLVAPCLIEIIYFNRNTS
ncbi:hypothetical protein BKA65DRAFT_243757 [Rhexocercosporidium sp. MPI-PUGE-AT-0058]|nr:hypothetical protein BKA65DRAFT_243757 [Rhexocercosporidium sp. MPI-PUGE-AT-0058]